MITRQSKVLFAFLSPQNPWWQDILPRPITQKDIASRMHLSQSTIANWRKGGKIDEANLKRSFDYLRTHVNQPAFLSPEMRRSKLDILHKFLDAYENSEKWHVYDVSEQILNLETGADQKILDEIIFDSFLIFPSLSYDTERNAEVDFRKYGGLYHAWIRRRGMWLDCTLRVRYVLEIRNAVVVRCKLNLPIIRSTPMPLDARYWEYDGFLRTQDNNVFWMFQKRELDGTDFLYFITSIGRLHGLGDATRQMLAGTYLTTGQNRERSVVSGNILLRQLTAADVDHELETPRYEDPRISRNTTPVRRWMHQTAFPITTENAIAEYEMIEGLWRDFTQVDGISAQMESFFGDTR